MNATPARTLRSRSPRYHVTPATAALALTLAGGLWLAGCGSEETPAATTTSPPKTTPLATATPPVTPTGTPAATDPAPGGTTDGPAMTVATDFHDFGEVSDVTPVTHSFPFTNTGKAPLEISKVKTSCGCTKAKASLDVVPPGATANIDVTYTPRGTGQHTYRVTVYTNAEPAETQLQIRADIDPFVAIEPRKLDLGVLPFHQEHKAYVTLSGHDPHMTVDSLTVRNEHLHVQIVDGDGDGLGASPSLERPGRAVIEVTVAADAPWGELKATILATIKGTPAGAREPVEHELYIPFSASMFDAIQVEPSMFRLGVIKPGEPVRESIQLVHAVGNPFEVVTATVENANVDGLRVEVEKADDGNGFQLVLSGDLGDHTGPVNGVVVFSTDLPGEIHRQMRFSGIVR